MNYYVVIHIITTLSHFQYYCITSWIILKFVCHLPSCTYPTKLILSSRVYRTARRWVLESTASLFKEYDVVIWFWNEINLALLLFPSTSCPVLYISDSCEMQTWELRTRCCLKNISFWHTWCLNHPSSYRTVATLQFSSLPLCGQWSRISNSSFAVVL